MTFKIDITGIETDIDEQEASRAHYNVSFSPEKRGASVVAEYVADMQRLAAFIESRATDERQQAIAQEVFDRLRTVYRKKRKIGLRQNRAAFQA